MPSLLLRPQTEPTRCARHGAGVVTLALLLGVGLVISAVTAPGLAQTDTDAQIAGLETEAMGALNAQDFEAALAPLNELIELAPEQPNYWVLYGNALRALDDLPGALQSYEQALAVAPRDVPALSAAAVVLERLQEVEKAFQHLEQAADIGLPSNVMRESPEFTAMRGYKQRFAIAVGKAVRRENPCKQEGPYDDFDFWIGEWDVYVGGVKRADSSITREFNGCLIRERYSNATGFQGESLNYYDPETDAWKQNWVDRTGGIVRYTGRSPSRDVMQMSGANTNYRGETQLAEVTWTRNSDGTVHHVIEQSTDNGETWSVYFDGIYVKKGQTLPAAYR